MGYKCELKEQNIQIILTIRTNSPVQELPQVFGTSYGAIMHYLEELGESPIGAPFAAYYNMDMQNLDIEIGFPVSRKLPDKGEIKSSEIPAGKFASCLFTGPYSDIEPAYNELTQWTKEKGYEPTGIAYEIYLNDPQITPPQELRTEIRFLLK